MGYKEIGYEKKSVYYSCNKRRQRENNKKFNLIKDYKYGYYGHSRWKGYKGYPKYCYYSEYI